MKTTIIANIILLPLVAVFFAPLAAALYMAVIVAASKRNPKLKKIWIDYYKVVTRTEYQLFKR